jgi:hypothetical protein
LNKKLSDEQNDVFVRRFFLYDTISALESALPAAVPKVFLVFVLCTLDLLAATRLQS